MIVSWLRLYLIYIYFIFQSGQVFCFNIAENEELGKKQKQPSGYNSIPVPRVGSVTVWEVIGNIEESTALKYKRKNVRFCSENVYLIFAHKLQGSFMVYYWLGNNASLIDKKLAAKGAVALSLFPKYKLVDGFRWTFINRETEGMESDSFYDTMKMFYRHPNPLEHTYSCPTYPERHFPKPRPNLYVIYGDSHSRIKKIPLSLGVQWLKKSDICLILEMEYRVEDMLPINYFCGTEASGKQIKRTTRFAFFFSDYIMYKWEHYTHSIENNKFSRDFKRFVEVFEDCRYYNPNEVDDSADHLKSAAEYVRSRDQKLALFDITTDGLIENRRRPIRSNIFKKDSMGYLLDSKSVAGVFLIFGDPKNMFNKSEAIQLAEEYMDDKYPSSSGQIVKMRIIETHVISQIIDFELNLSDHPPIARELPDDALW